MPEARAVVLLSGGLDSATCLGLARAANQRCYALSVNYGQRHGAELAAAREIATTLGAVEFREAKVDLGQFGGSALTDDSLAVPQSASAGIPITYVPARNTVFLALATAWAEVIGATEIVCGVNAVDYSGYPDCRPEFIAAFENVVRLGTKAGVEGARLRIRTPLISWSKAEIIRQGTVLGLDYGRTVSCYAADSQGRACGRCEACRLRREGFIAAGVADPTRYK